MPKAVKLSIAAIIILTAIMVAAVSTMLHRPTENTSAVPASETAATTTAAVASRPQCPGGINLPCLGSTVGPATGKAMVVNIWAWWCEPCRSELPLIDKLAQRSDITVVGVQADPQAANGAAMLNDLGISLPSYEDATNSFAATYSLPSVVPITVLLRPDGSLVQRFTQSFDSYEELNSAINSALAQI